MQLLHVLLMSLIFPVASLTSADTTTFDSVDWSNVDDSADLGISEPDMFDNHEANPSLNLFSDVDPDGPAWDSSTSLDGSSSPIEFSTDTAVDDSAAACLSSSFQNSLSTNDLQTRSPIQCPNNLDNSDPGSTTTTPTTPTDNLDDQIMKTFERKFSVPGVWPNARLCPFERYGLRSLALCDSGLHDDVIQDDDNWVINLKNPSPCTYDSIVTA